MAGETEKQDEYVDASDTEKVRKMPDVLQQIVTAVNAAKAVGGVNIHFSDKISDKDGPKITQFQLWFR